MKMPCCCVPNCKNRSERGVRLFAVPQGERNKARRDQWMSNIKREILPLYAYVCEVHFTEDQFENNRLDKKRPLKCTAVPTVFLKQQENTGLRRKIKIEGEINEDVCKHEPVKLKREDNSADDEFENMVKCRTCLDDTNKGNCSVMKKLLYGITIKQMLIKCIPQMFDTVSDDNYICDKCLRCLLKFRKFVETCLEVESKILDGKVTFESEQVNTIVENKEKNITKVVKKQKKDKMIDSNKDKPEVKLIDKTEQSCSEVRSKRKRKKRKIENCADDEEIEAYLAEDYDTASDLDATKTKSGEEKSSKESLEELEDKKHRKSDKDFDYTEELLQTVTRKKRNYRKFVKGDESPKMEIIDKAMGMVIRTYERKRPIVKNEENNVKSSTQLDSIGSPLEERSNITLEKHTSSPLGTNFRTYERKKNLPSTKTNKEASIEDHVVTSVVNKHCEIIDIDCNTTGSFDEHTLGSVETRSFELISNHEDCEETEKDENCFSIDHDYIVQSDSEGSSIESITLLNENGELLSVASQEIPEEDEIEKLPKHSDQSADDRDRTCPQCLTYYRTKRGIRDHLMRVHNIQEEEYMFCCPVCCEEFINSDDMLEHKRKHGLPCNLCGEIFSSEEELKSHKENHPPKYLCTKCGQQFKTESRLEEHTAMHTIMNNIMKKQRKRKLPPKRYTCDMCPLVFRFPARLRLHRNIVHLKLKEHKCQECGKMFGSRGTLKIHYSVTHQDEKPFQCDVCGKSFKRIDYLKYHTSLHHLEHRQLTLTIIDKNKKLHLLPCDFCGATFKNKISLRKHLTTHSRIRRYQCDFCGLKFLHQRTKFVHERSHNVDPDKKFVCPVCWKRVSTKDELDIHYKTHDRKLKRYKCLLCEKSFSRKMLLENHILEVHTSEEVTQSEEEVSLEMARNKIPEHEFDRSEIIKLEDCYE